MPQVLAYARRLPSDARFHIPPAIFPILLTFAHLYLCWQLNQPLILRLCRSETIAPSVWAPAAWIPGVILAQSFGPLGVLLMILPSLLAGFLLWEVIVRYRDGLRPIFGPAAWRFLLLLFLWLCWVPVPAPYSFAYCFCQWAANISG